MLLLYVACVLVTGAATVALSFRGQDPPPTHALILSLGFGFMASWFVPSLLAGILGLFVRFEMTQVFVACVLVALAGGAATLGRRARGTFRPQWLRKGHDRTAIVLLAATAVAFAVAFDSHLLAQDSCLVRAAVVPYHNYLTADTPMVFTPDYILEKNAFLVWDSGQRLGPTFMLAPFLALFRNPGFRLLNVMCGVVSVGFVYLLAINALKRRWAAVVAAVFVGFNPMVLAIPHPDENLLALACAAGAFCLALDRTAPAWAAGALMGLALGTRESFVVSLPALAMPYVLTSRWKDACKAAAGLVLGALPWIALHLGMYFGPTGNLYQSFAAKPPVRYEIFGQELFIQAYLGWPFVNDLVRSPFNGFPTLVEYPLEALRTFGIIGVALSLLGLWGGGGLHLRTRLVALAWSLPFMAVVMVQSGWVEPNKMGLLLDVSPQVGLLAAAGAVALSRVRDVGWRKGAVVSGVFAALVAGLALKQAGAVRDDYPLDKRLYQSADDVDSRFVPAPEYEIIKSEPAYAALDRDQLTRLDLLPDYGRIEGLWRPSAVAYRLRQAAREAWSPAFIARSTPFKDVALSVIGFPLERFMQGHGPGLPLPVVTGERARENDQKMPRLFAKAREMGLTELPLSWLTHRPVDQIEGEPSAFRCQSEPVTEGTTLRFDFAVPSVANPAFVTAVQPGPAAVPLRPGQIVIVRGLAGFEADGRALNVMALLAPEGAVYVTWVMGNVPFGYARTLCQVVLVDAPTAGTSVDFLVPSNSPLYVRQTSSHQPRSYHGWQGYVGDNDVTLGEAFRTSY